VVFYGESLDFYLALGAALILVANYLNLKRQA
jgi:drug/metabolite transporter (DMT)-like permease